MASAKYKRMPAQNQATPQEKFVNSVLLRAGDQVSPTMRAYLDAVLAMSDKSFERTMRFFDECNTHNFGRAA